MRRFFGILIVGLLAVAAFASTALAGSSDDARQVPAAVHKPQSSEVSSSTDTGFAPEGLARDVLNLFTGIRQPLDKSTSLTIQAGKSLRFGISF